MEKNSTDMRKDFLIFSMLGLNRNQIFQFTKIISSFLPALKGLIIKFFKIKS